MKRIRVNSQVGKLFQGRSRGFSLIEVVIAIALIALIGVAVLSALSTASLALIIADQRATAESLARSQMEYVKDNIKNPYDGNMTAPHPQYSSLAPSILPLPTGYSVNTTAVRLDPMGDGLNNDDGVQKIAVTVRFKDEVLVGLEDYKRRPAM